MLVFGTIVLGKNHAPGRVPKNWNPVRRTLAFVPMASFFARGLAQLADWDWPREKR